MSKTKFYIGQPVELKETGLVILAYKGLNLSIHRPVLGLPNVWYQWDGGTEPPCDDDQEVLVQYDTGDIVGLLPADNMTWNFVKFYMIIKAPEVI